MFRLRWLFFPPLFGASVDTNGAGGRDERWSGDPSVVDRELGVRRAESGIWKRFWIKRTLLRTERLEAGKKKRTSENPSKMGSFFAQIVHM